MAEAEKALKKANSDLTDAGARLDKALIEVADKTAEVAKLPQLPAEQRLVNDVARAERQLKVAQKNLAKARDAEAENYRQRRKAEEATKEVEARAQARAKEMAAKPDKEKGATAGVEATGSTKKG
jgi:hypothetical protein